MTLNRAVTAMISLLLIGGLSACGKDDIRLTCDEAQLYQDVVAGKRVVVPDGLDPLDELKEMPVPKSESPPRAADAECIERPPSVLRGDPA